MRDQREDTQSIEALIASQNGYISHDQLDQFHPQSAVEFREKASKLEKLKLNNSMAISKYQLLLIQSLMVWVLKEMKRLLNMK